MILSPEESGGKMIALEGGWGAGKTTVISLLKKKLRNKDDITVFSYDAWAHEGDPLRRTFLESLIRHFQNFNKNGWINKESSNKVLEKLANRLKVTKTRTIPKVTILGKVFALSVLLVPISSPLLTQALRQGITVDTSHPFSWTFFLGLLCAIAPFLVIAGNFIRIMLRPSKRTGLNPKNCLGDCIGGEEELGDWAFIGSHSIEETKQETIETPQPTSIEFQDEFCKIMEEALSGIHRKVIMVLDNLDRVDAKDALGIWSTLQTFLQCGNDGTEAWFKKLWIIIPYDPDGLRQLWMSRVTNDETHSALENQVISNSFMDKSFQLRFKVPPPLLSNWKIYLEMLALQALPKHTNEELHAIYQVFRLARVKDDIAPTPRELKLYINQIGTIHRQWQHEFPLDHIAYYVVLCRRGENIPKTLLDGKLPDPNIIGMTSPNLMPNLAGLCFNVTATLGQQLLLADPITDALAKGDADTLKGLQEKHKAGFWTVMESIMTEKGAGSTATEVANAASCLRSAKILDDAIGIERNIILSALKRSALDIEIWAPIDEEVAKGILAICTLISDPQCSSQVLSKLRDTIASTPLESRVSLDYVTIQALANIYKGIASIDQSSILQPFTLCVDARGWMDVSLHVFKQGEQWWHFFKPQADIKNILEAIRTIIEEGALSNDTLDVIRVTNRSLPNYDWSPLALAMEERMSADQDSPASETHLLLQGLSLLKDFGCSQADASLDLLVEEGHLMHKLDQIEPEDDQECVAHLVTTFLERRPNAARSNPVGNSKAGYDILMKLLDTDNPELAKLIVDILDSEDKIKVLIEIVDARGEYDSLIISCLRYIADSDSPERLFTPEVLISKWSDLLEHLNTDDNDLFDKLIAQISSRTNLLEAIRGQEGGFNYEDALLYRSICTVSTSQTFREWCQTGLEALDSKIWKEQLDIHGEAIDLLLFLLDSGTNIALKQSFQDALLSHAESVLDGKAKIDENLANRWPKLLEALGSHASRNVFRRRLLSKTISREGKCAEDFFQLYGEELSADSTLFFDETSVVAKLFSPLLRDRNVFGLRWLKGLFEKIPEILEKSNDRDAVDDLIERIQGELRRSADDSDQVQTFFVEIAAILGIIIDGKDSMEESDVVGLLKEDVK